MRDDYAQEKADPAWTSRPPQDGPSRRDLHHALMRQRIQEALGRGDMRTARMLTEQDTVNMDVPVEPSEFQPTDLAVPGLQSALSTLASAPGRAMVGGALRAAPGAMVNVAKQAKSLPLRASTDYQKNALWKALSGEEPSAAQKLNAMIRNRTMPDPRVTLESRTGDTKLTNQFWTPQNEFGYTPQMKRMLSRDQTIPDEQFAAKMWGQNLDDYLAGQTRKDFPGFSLDESGMPARMGGEYLWPEQYAAKMDAKYPYPAAGRPFAWPARPQETIVDPLTHAVRTQGQKMLPAAQSQEARLSSALEGPAGAAPEGAPFTMPRPPEGPLSWEGGRWVRRPYGEWPDTPQPMSWDAANAATRKTDDIADMFGGNALERRRAQGNQGFQYIEDMPRYEWPVQTKPFPDKRNLDEWYGPGASMDRLYSDYPPVPSQFDARIPRKR